MINKKMYMKDFHKFQNQKHFKIKEKYQQKIQIKIYNIKHNKNNNNYIVNKK